MNTKRVLIVWSEIPEKIALVPLTTDEATVEKLRSWNNQYINSVETPDDMQTEMNDFFYPSNGYFAFKELESTGPLVNEKFDLVVQCGFIL